MDVYAFHEVHEDKPTEGYVTHEMNVRDPYRDYYDFPHHDERWHKLKAVFNTILFEWSVWVDEELVDVLTEVGLYKEQAKSLSPEALMTRLFC